MIYALSCAQPSDVNGMLQTIQPTGVGFYQGNDLQRIRYPYGTAHFHGSLPKTHLMMLSDQCQSDQLENIQPYYRPVCGQSHLFMMEGELHGLEDELCFPVGIHKPIGGQIEERAFCVLLQRIFLLWADGPPIDEVKLALLSDYSNRLQRLGWFNGFYSNGQWLIAFSNPKGPTQRIAFRVQESLQMVEFSNTYEEQEGWQYLENGEVVMAYRGQLIQKCSPIIILNDY